MLLILQFKNAKVSFYSILMNALDCKCNVNIDYKKQIEI